MLACRDRWRLICGCHLIVIDTRCALKMALQFGRSSRSFLCCTIMVSVSQSPVVRAEAQPKPFTHVRNDHGCCSRMLASAQGHVTVHINDSNGTLSTRFASKEPLITHGRTCVKSGGADKSDHVGQILFDIRPAGPVGSRIHLVSSTNFSGESPAVSQHASTVRTRFPAKPSVIRGCRDAESASGLELIVLGCSSAAWSNKGAVSLKAIVISRMNSVAQFGACTWRWQRRGWHRCGRVNHGLFSCCTDADYRRSVLHVVALLPDIRLYAC